MSNLSNNEILHLITEAKELWLWTEEYKIGYQERYRVKARLAKILRVTTIFAGVLTAISTSPGLEFLSYLTTVAAALTGVVAFITQILVPEKSQMEVWETVRKIESQQKDISSRSRGMNNVSDYQRELFELQRIQKSISDAVSTDIDITDYHKNMAKEKFKNVKLDPVSVGFTNIVQESDEGMIEEAKIDVSNVVVRTRKRTTI